MTIQINQQFHSVSFLLYTFQENHITQMHHPKDLMESTQRMVNPLDTLKNLVNIQENQVEDLVVYQENIRTNRGMKIAFSQSARKISAGMLFT